MCTCVHRLGLTAPSVSCGKTALAIRVNGSIIIFCSTIDFDWSVVLRLLKYGHLRKCTEVDCYFDQWVKETCRFLRSSVPVEGASKARLLYISPCVWSWCHPVGIVCL